MPSSPPMRPTAKKLTAAATRIQCRGTAAKSLQPWWRAHESVESMESLPKAGAQAAAAGSWDQGPAHRRYLVGPALDRGARAAFVELLEPPRTRTQLRSCRASPRPRGRTGQGHRARHRLACDAVQGHVENRAARRGVVGESDRRDGAAGGLRRRARRWGGESGRTSGRERMEMKG